MLNWSALVRHQLDRLGISPAQQEEIVAELAGHLEDLYEQHRAEGCGPSEAIERVLREVTEWRQLARGIRRAKCEEDEMNNRTKRLWLPGLVSLVAAQGFLMILEQAGLPIHFFKLRSISMPLYPILWLGALPLFGAIGAYLSRRAGGDLLARLAAGVFPSIALLALICFGVLAALISGHRTWWVAILLGMFYWVVLPGVALVLGALPFLKASKSMVPSTN